MPWKLAGMKPETFKNILFIDLQLCLLEMKSF